MTLASVEGSRRHVVVVAAAMDEADDIEEIYERLHCAVLAPPFTRAEFIWVGDETAAMLKGLSQRDGTSACTIIKPQIRRGLGAAFRHGFAAVPDSADVAVTMDADLNHHPTGRSHGTRTTRKRASPFIIRAYPFAASVSGTISIIGRTPSRALKRMVSSESAARPDGQPATERRLPMS